MSHPRCVSPCPLSAPPPDSLLKGKSIPFFPSSSNKRRWSSLPPALLEASALAFKHRQLCSGRNQDGGLSRAAMVGDGVRVRKKCKNSTIPQALSTWELRSRVQVPAEPLLATWPGRKFFHSLRLNRACHMTTGRKPLAQSQVSLPPGWLHS